MGAGQSPREGQIGRTSKGNPGARLSGTQIGQGLPAPSLRQRVGGGAAGWDDLEVGRYLLARVDLADVLLELVLDAGAVRTVRALERLDRQVCGQVSLQVPLAREAAAAGGTLEGAAQCHFLRQHRRRRRRLQHRKHVVSSLGRLKPRRLSDPRAPTSPGGTSARISPATGLPRLGSHSTVCTGSHTMPAPGLPSHALGFFPTTKCHMRWSFTVSPKLFPGLDTSHCHSRNKSCTQKKGSSWSAVSSLYAFTFG